MNSELFYEEQLQSKEHMMAMTTGFLVDIQSRLEQKNKEVEDANRSIKNSIQFAQLIQQSLLPDQSLLHKYFEDSFYLVSQQMGIGGDMIFIREEEEGVLFGLFDSTGHGIPAAMLSVSTTLLLSELSHLTPKRTDLILSALNRRLYTTFRNEKNDIAHVEGSLFFYNKTKGTINFSLSRGKVFVIEQEKVQYLRVMSEPAGSHSETRYTEISIPAKKGTRILLYSDGLTDQFGGTQNKKFGTERLKKLLSQHVHLSLHELKDLIYREHLLWKGLNEQTDDLSFLIIQI